jgi:peptide/nickel transport system permease protein
LPWAERPLATLHMAPSLERVATMLKYIANRLLGLLGTLLLLSVVTFFLAHSIPGGPYSVNAEIPLSDAQIAQFKKLYGLDRPLWEQYLKFLWNAVHLDFGYSFQSPKDTCSEIIARTWPTSIHMGLMAWGTSTLLGLAVGLYQAYHQNTWMDYVTTLMSTATMVTPTFVIGLLLMFLFSVRLHWLPTGGWSGPKTWIMPVLAMGINGIGSLARFTRAVVIDAMRADHVRTARAKGLSELKVVLRHVFRNALIPLLTVIVPAIPGAITGTIFVEGLFRIPGLGKWFVYSSFKRDYPMIMAITLFFAALISVTYLFTDLLYALVDPRVRLGESAR